MILVITQSLLLVSPTHYSYMFCLNCISSCPEVFCKKEYCLTLPWIQLQVLLRCCLMYITITIMRHNLYFVHLCPCLGLILFMSYQCDPFFIFGLVFIIINRRVSLKRTHLLFTHFSEYLILVLDDNMDAESD